MVGAWLLLDRYFSVRYDIRMKSAHHNALLLGLLLLPSTGGALARV